MAQLSPPTCRFHLAGLALLAVLLLSGPPSHGQDSPREVRALANQALAAGDFETAASYLLQLIGWYKDSDNAKTIAGMEAVYYNVGLCYYLTGRFGEAGKRFSAYLKRYPKGMWAIESSVFIGDSQRYGNNLDGAFKSYEKTLKTYKLNNDWTTDVLCSMARCALAQDDWEKALPLLEKARVFAPDWTRRNWAGTLLTTAYLKEMDLEKVFDLVPVLMQRGSFASRSIAFNMAALEAADLLFADENYREALWLYRLVYPRDVIETGSQRHLATLQRQAEWYRDTDGMYRELLRNQEAIGEVEAELEALSQVENYTVELFFRMARSYMETRLFREARRLFLYLHETAEGEQAEEALYLAFHCSTQLPNQNRAFELGHAYMEKYPGKTYYDAVSLAVGQLYAMQKDWRSVITVLSKALEVSPKHESVSECMFLIGYAYFMEETFGESIGWLKRLNETYPGNDREEEADYWLAMGLLFDTKYGLSKQAFGTFLVRYPNSMYQEDATFRRAVASYGLSEYREAEELFLAFVDAFPDSKLRGEAVMMLADISANFGELDTAVERFRDAITYELNIELYNYCCFKCGEILNDEKRFADLVAHFRAYIDRNRPESNIPQAIHWVVKGLWMQDEQEGAMAYFLEGVKKFGGDRLALGVDVLLDEWVGLSRKLDTERARQAWRNLTDMMNDAAASNNRVLELRLKRLLLYRQGIETAEKSILMADLVREANVEDASPAVLELIADEALKADKRDLALRAANEIIDVFPETDYGIAARMLVARDAVEAEDWDIAAENLDYIIENAAASLDAAQALNMKARMLIAQRKYDDADDCFTRILGVREWRGPLWPEAIYGRGECARARRRYDQAAALYERIYLLYSNYTHWAAKAYLRRAECLLKLRRNKEAREVLRELIAAPEYADLPEKQEAEQVLSRLEGGTDG